MAAFRSRWASNPASFIEEAGYTGIVATNSEFEIERYPRLGDVISVTQEFEDISDEKKTSLGTGHFVTWLSTYTDQNGEVLGRQRFRVFRFKANRPPPERLGTDGDQTGADGQPGQRVLLEWVPREQAADPALHRVSGATPAGTADVPDV